MNNLLNVLHFRKVMDETNSSNSDSTYYRIYLLVLGVYAAIRLSFGLLVKIPACHKLSEISDRHAFFQFFKWIYEVGNITQSDNYIMQSMYMRSCINIHMQIGYTWSISCIRFQFLILVWLRLHLVRVQCRGKPPTFVWRPINLIVLWLLYWMSIYN